ncbi:hypothetical protein FRB93_011022 [Tulasnella sp. JGI-2019a]|nr:hypothetical protein FRB93_011022 [Tulasnella sp. JGI-2019a]
MGDNFRDGADHARLTFQGRGGDDVTIFLQALKRIANAQGRQRDNDWLVDAFEMCLAGPALRWYSLLDDNVQSDFKRLRLAALERFAPVEHVPEPPAAAPLRSAALPMVGRVKISDLAGKVLGFCARPRITDVTFERCPLVTAPTEGVIVEYRAHADGLSLMKVVSVSSFQAYLCQIAEPVPLLG